MNIIQAIKDPNLFGPFFGNDLRSWRPWLAALRVIYGLPLKVGAQRRKVISQCTGRSISGFPATGFDSALILTGRRSGKSRVAAVVGAFEAVLAGHEKKLAKGERGVVPIIAPTKAQGRIVKDYLRAIFEVPLLANELERETQHGFDLKSGNRIEILAGDFRTIRGYTLLAAIVDEIAFFGIDDESKIKSDTELVRAIKPSLVTVGGKLYCISSPYAKKGWCYKTYKRHFGSEKGTTLVWNCPSRTMNPMLPQSVVDEALAEDMQAAKSEYLGEFRDDVGEFLPRAIIEELVVPNRMELEPRPHKQYVAFADLSGGRGDDAALAIAHKDEERTVVIDFAKRWKPPFNPNEVVSLMCKELKRYHVTRITGDNYAAEFVSRSFERSRIRYTKADKPKSALYTELLPRLCSGDIELLDDDLTVTQLASLERRTRSGGKDIIDHPPGGHDDLANVIAGVSVVAAAKRICVGAL